MSVRVSQSEGMAEAVGGDLPGFTVPASPALSPT